MKQVLLRYLGNSAFEFQTENGLRILIDPHITGNPLCPISIDQLSRPDLILVSHAAHDHMSDVPELARRFQCRVICDPGVGHFLRKQEISRDQITSMVWGQVFPFGSVRVRVVESKHISFRDGETAITGLPLGFIIYTESGFRLYHSGDTSIFSDLKLFGRLYRPHVGLILVGNYPGNLAELSPEEAALACKWLGLKVAIPMHYEKGSEDPEHFLRALTRESPKTKGIVLEPGKTQAFLTAKFLPKG